MRPSRPPAFRRERARLARGEGGPRGQASLASRPFANMGGWRELARIERLLVKFVERGHGHWRQRSFQPPAFRRRAGAFVRARLPGTPGRAQTEPLDVVFLPAA